MEYFSEREKGPIPRTIEEITPGAWKGIWAIVMTRLQNGSFGHAFPEQCPDGNAFIGHHPGLFEAAIQGEGIVWVLAHQPGSNSLPNRDVMRLLLDAELDGLAVHNRQGLCLGKRLIHGCPRPQVAATVDNDRMSSLLKCFDDGVENPLRPSALGWRDAYGQAFRRWRNDAAFVLTLTPQEIASLGDQRVR